MKKSMLALIFGSALFLAACGGGEESAKDKETQGGATAVSEGQTLVQQNCFTCHGNAGQGMGSAPALKDVGSRLSQDEIAKMITDGSANGMPAFKDQLGEEKIAKMAEWLATQK